VSEAWDGTTPGVVTLPSGRRVRGRGLQSGPPPGPDPEFGLYLLRQRPPEQPWPSRWVRWPDFWVPSSPEDAAAALREAWHRAATERVEIACAGGTGRTGTALACLAVLDGVPAEEAVAFVRRHYRPRAVETPGQRRFVTRFSG
jgi:protein-tyrosine phosphatase